MATVAQAGMPAGTSAGPPAARKLSLSWLGVVPFFLFAILFLVAPTPVSYTHLTLPTNREV